MSSQSVITEENLTEIFAAKALWLKGLVQAIDENGFDFLGYHISPDGLTLAEKTIENFFERAARLYKQKPGEENSSRLELYVRRFVRWSEVGLSSRYSGCVCRGEMPTTRAVA